MVDDKKIEAILLNHPICEYAFGDVDQIPFSEKVLMICQSDCPRYGKCWTCPPYCGSLKELEARCRKYRHFCMFSTVTQTSDVWDDQEDLKVKGVHEAVTADICNELKEILPDLLMLSTGCMKCETCTCPDSPCRFPDEQVSSMESYGIVAMQLAQELGLTFQYESGTIVYFSMFLY